MHRLASLSLVLGLTLSATAQQSASLRGITYGYVSAPSGQEWQAPEHYAHAKEQPHTTIYPFANEREALGVLPERSSYYQSLNGTWRFNWVGNPEERPKLFYLHDYDDRGWDEVRVPMSWNVAGIERDGRQRYGTPIYLNQPVIFWHELKVDDWRGGVMRTPPKHWTTYKHRNEVGSHRRTFEIPKAWMERQTFIQFEGVDSFFYLWVNGRYVGFSKNSRNTAEFDITPYLKAGRNTLAVEVYRSSDGSFLESQDMFRLPGIYRSVGLISKPKAHIRDLQITPSITDDGAKGELTIRTEVRQLGRKGLERPSLRYTLYRLPLYSDEGAEPVGVEATIQLPNLQPNECPSHEARLTLAHPEAWSAEAPHRYVLVAQLRDKRGQVIETVSSYTGFRQVEIRDVKAEDDEFGLSGRYFLINGKPAKLKGVNRHETHPATGHALTHEMMHEEVMMLKRANINHVRNSHYPTDPYFYYLCDKYGIYLEDEANIESHQYYYGKESLSHVKEFDTATTNRMLEMVHANLNHPSIVIWSLGNEAGPGVNFVHAYEATKAVDASRPIQYERNNDIVDMGSNQYPSIPWVQEASRGNYNIKYPFHISEYAHSMGNAVGGLQDYWTAIESTNYICGGAIWDWVDQALYNYTPDGTRYLAYGGDFGDTPNDGMFVMNGIIFADRTPKPQYYEVKKVYQHIGMTGEGEGARRIRIFNKHYYTDLSDYQLVWTLEAEGIAVETGILSLPHIAPRSSALVEVSYTTELSPSREYYLRLEMQLLVDKPWAKRGYTQADEQVLVRPALELPRRPEAKGKLDLSPSHQVRAGMTKVKGSGFEVSFDHTKGTMQSLYYNGVAMIREGEGPRLDPFRAMCDNDNWAYPAWGANGLHNLQHKVLDAKVYRRTDGAVVVAFALESSAPNVAIIKDHRASGRYQITEDPSKPLGADDFKLRSAQTYTIYADGSIELQAGIVSNKPTLALARLGFSLQLPSELSQYSYYGRGPINNYSDRKTSQFVGLYRSTVKDQFVPFPKPQTMGNREEVRWVTLTSESGQGLLIQSERPISVSALPWSAKELLLAPHPHELPPSSGTHLHLDASVNGLGGNSCGQGPPLEHCRSYGQPATMSLLIRPYQSGAEVERVALQGDMLPLVARSAEGYVSILSRPGDKLSYSTDGKRYQPYNGSFAFRSSGEIKVRHHERPALGASAQFGRIESIPISVLFVSSEELGWYPATNLLDGNPETIWHTTYSVTSAKYPHWVDFDASEERAIRGFRYLPRTGSITNGNIKAYSISISNDAQRWHEVHRGEFPESQTEHKVLFGQAVKARYVRFTALSGHTATDHASGAEFGLIAD